MASKNHTSLLSAAYAQALLELADERNVAQPMAEQLEVLAELVGEYPTFRQFLADPGISPEERSGVLERVFKNRIDPLLYDTLRLLNARGRLGLIQRIAEAYRQLLDEKMGRVKVEVTVAQCLDDHELKQVKDQISQALNKDAMIQQKVDQNLIGGIVLRMGDRLIDGSVRRQLQMLKEKLLMR